MTEVEKEKKEKERERSEKNESEFEGGEQEGMVRFFFWTSSFSFKHPKDAITYYESTAFSIL